MASSGRPSGRAKTEKTCGQIHVSDCLVQRRLATVRVVQNDLLRIETR